jgi:hypothetical protein
MALRLVCLVGRDHRGRSKALGPAGDIGLDLDRIAPKVLGTRSNSIGLDRNVYIANVIEKWGVGLEEHSMMDSIRCGVYDM